MLTCGSLFAGIGGFDLGFERAGIKTIWQVEIDEYCRRVLARHFPDAERFGDIRECGAHNLKPVDIICGGDPCQQNSNSCRAASAVTPSAGNEFIRIVDELRPQIVVRENPSVVRSDAPWTWQRFRSDLEYLGYLVLPFRLRACCVGADIQRDRLFLLATIPLAQCPRLEGDECEVLARENERRSDSDITRPDRWSAAPRVCRAVDGIPSRMDRLRALGNAVVPQIAEWIGRRIVEAAQ